MLRLLVILIACGLFAGALAAGRIAVRRLLQRGRGRAVAAAPIPDGWLPYLERHVPIVRRLSPDQRQRLLQKAQQFMDGCHWEGCAGLELTAEMRLTIAAQACLLVLEHEGDPYPAVETILIYPATFRPRHFSWTPSADGSSDGDPTLGESWDHGVVVLAWDSTEAGGADPADGKNVVLHEFAHQLDSTSGETDGVPHLPVGAYEPWSRMLERDFARLVIEAEHRRQGVLDHYGATNRAEFFAVATEAFFERPWALRRERPELYGALREYYRQDPAAWLPARTSTPESSA